MRVEAYDFSSRSLPNRLDDFIGHAIDSHAEFLKKRFAFRIEILKAKYVRIGKSGHNDRCGNPLFQRDALGKAFDRRFRGAIGGNARKRTQRRRASYVDNLGPYTLFKSGPKVSKEYTADRKFVLTASSASEFPRRKKKREVSPRSLREGRV